MPVMYMQAITARYLSLGYQPYRWFTADSPPAWQPLRKPLREARLGLLSTSGAYALGQVAYHYRDDCSIREIPAATPDAELRFSHITENYLVDPRRDPGCIFPSRALRRLVGRGVIGSLADRLLSCMGGVYSQRRVREEVAPAVLAALRAQEVDAALLVAM
jgi:D-proline reductase (dithiol) PrdB